MLAKPIADYQSTDFNDDIEDEGVEWNDNSFNASHLGLNILKKLKESPLGAILIILSLFAIVAMTIKTIAQKLSQDSEPLIGLNNSYAKDSGILRELNRSKALQDAQAELTKAHAKYQNYLKDKYQDNIKAPKTDSIKKSIALNQYQKSTINPYSNQEAMRINKDYVSKDNFQIPPRPKMQENKPQQTIKKEFTSPYIQRKSNSIDYKPKQEAKINNLKFLESVTKIYEQSGRNDLAQGLRTSMSHVK